VLLADDIIEPLRTVFAGDDLIGHVRFTIYDLRADCNCEAKQK
jgi:hypothetical protein